MSQRLIKAAWEDFAAELVPIECEFSVLTPCPSPFLCLCSSSYFVDSLICVCLTHNRFVKSNIARRARIYQK